MSKPRAKLSTLGAHAGSAQPPSPTPPVDVPITASTTFHFPNRKAVVEYNAAHPPTSYMYSRDENPTVRAVEQKLAILEGAESCLTFGSGMAAISTTALTLLSSTKGMARPLLCSTAIYGGAYRLFRDVLGPLNLPVVFVSPETLVSGDWPVKPRAVYAESPTNPTTRVLDLEKLAGRAREAGALSVIDATFATPALVRPIELGVDLVIHSATKYLGGHSDLLAGAVLGRRELLAPIERLRALLGGVLSPELAATLSRSLKTLELRVLHQSATALELARRLSADRRVKAVLYPGLPSHPDHALAVRQLRAFGGVLTLDLSGGEAAAARVYDSLRVFARAASLGGVESLASLPIDSSHQGFSDAELEQAGVTRGMIRLSIGVEDVDDLWEDLDQALPG
jgi:cystathionine gamma-synthase